MFKAHNNIRCKHEPSEISLNSTGYDFSVDHSSNEKENILNFH